MPHLGAAYNLAGWLTRSAHDADDVVQEAYLRAFRAFSGYRGGDARTWLLRIVRNTCYTWLRQRHRDNASAGPDELAELPDEGGVDPETQLIRRADAQRVRSSLDALPVELREAVVLREFEGLSYKEIAEVADIPLGTVMSRLSRGRKHLERALRSGGLE
jgi:RNA polymerase sigma factor (sigma-70 family)